MPKASLYRPMTPGGGAFLACVGALLIAGSMQPEKLGLYLMVGFASGVVALVATVVTGIRLRHQRPSLFQRTIFVPIIALEIGAMLLASQYLPHDMRTIWTAALIITGLHFLPMYWSFGWLIVALGVLCTAAACVGGIFGLPLSAIVAIDGALKLAFGLAMFNGLFGGQLARPAGLIQHTDPIVVIPVEAKRRSKHSFDGSTCPPVLPTNGSRINPCGIFRDDSR